jgi:hypothetical protein
MNSQPNNPSEGDLRTHFMIGVISDESNGIKKAHVFWGADQNGETRTLKDFNLSQLGVEILEVHTSKNGSGQLCFRGQLAKKYYPKD